MHLASSGTPESVQGRLMDDLTIRRRVREIIATGELPCDDRAGLWGGMGRGTQCGACAEPIRTGQVEYEVNLRSGQKILMHPPCHAIWLEECERAWPAKRRAKR
jgi:hypothetical protein